MSTKINGVPQDQVGSSVQAAIDAGATKVECDKQADGTWTITAS